MLLETRDAPPFYKNGYVLACSDAREAVIVDPGDEVDELLKVVSDHALQVRHILLTHGHVDHVSGSGAGPRPATAAPVVLHRSDLFLYDGALQQASFFGLDIEPLPPVDRFYDASGPIVFGDCEATVLHTPGHTPGGVCLLVGPAAGRQRSCSPAIPCSPARSAGRISSAATTTRCSTRSTASCSRWMTTSRSTRVTDRRRRSERSGGRTRSWWGGEGGAENEN